MFRTRHHPGPDDYFLIEDCNSQMSSGRRPRSPFDLPVVKKRKKRKRTEMQEDEQQTASGFVDLVPVTVHTLLTAAQSKREERRLPCHLGVVERKWTCSTKP